MVRNHHLSKKYSGQRLGLFQRTTVLKAANAGREIAFVNPAYRRKTAQYAGIAIARWNSKIDSGHAPSVGRATTEIPTRRSTF